MTVKHDGNNYELLNVIDISKRYGERCVVTSRSEKVMMSKFEEIWMCQDGAPSQFRSDPEFTKPFFKKYLNVHNVVLNDRPARSSNNTSCVERNNGVFKSIFAKTSKENTKANIELLVARTSFLCNIPFRRSKVTAFRLSREYLPSTADIPVKRMTQEVLDAYAKLSAYRAIQMAIKQRTPKIIHSTMIKTGHEIYIFYKTTNTSVDIGWIKPAAVEPKAHYVQCTGSSKEITMGVSYEHIRLIPSNDLARQMTVIYLE